MGRVININAKRKRRPDDAYYEQAAAELNAVLGVNVPPEFIRRAEEIVGKPLADMTAGELRHAATLERQRLQHEIKKLEDEMAEISDATE